MDKRSKTALVLNFAIIILELIGTAISFSNGGAGNLIYYTVLSNILALVSSVLFVSLTLKGREGTALVSALRYCASVCLAVTFTVVVFVFVPMTIPYGTTANVLYKGPQLYHHLLCPIVSFVSFCFFENGAVSRSFIAIGALPTLLYAVFSITLNLLRVIEGPYPFLMVYKQSWVESVIWFFVILGIGVAFAAVVRLLHNKNAKKRGGLL